MRDDKWWKWGSNYSKIILYKTYWIQNTEENVPLEEELIKEELIISALILTSAKFQSVCSLSGREINIGNHILYNPVSKKAQLALKISNLYEYRWEEQIVFIEGVGEEIRNIFIEEKREEESIRVWNGYEQIAFRPLIIDIYHHWLNDWISEWMDTQEFEEHQQFKNDNDIIDIIIRELYDDNAYPKTSEDVDPPPFLNLFDFKAKAVFKQ